MKRAEGFTLVELLVVIAIVALLFAMLMPTFIGIEVIKQKTHCQKNLADIVKWFNAYATMNDGAYPGPSDHYYGTKFSGPWVAADRWAGMPQVNQLRQVGAKPESFWCPFDPKYGNWNRWPTNTWTKPFRITWGDENTVYVYVGYNMLINRSGRFVDGRGCPSSYNAEDDTPLVADLLFIRAGNTLGPGGWLHGGGPEDGLFNSGCNTAFRGGEVWYTEAGAFDWNKPAKEVGGHDFYWFALAPAEVPVP